MCSVSSKGKLALVSVSGCNKLNDEEGGDSTIDDICNTKMSWA